MRSSFARLSHANAACLSLVYERHLPENSGPPIENAFHNADVTGKYLVTVPTYGVAGSNLKSEFIEIFTDVKTRDNSAVPILFCELRFTEIITIKLTR